MAEDWKAGDLAECIITRRIHLPGRRPAEGGAYLTKGMVYIVQEVVPDSAHGGLCLEVGAKWGPKLARRFRKVPPLGEAVLRQAQDERPFETASPPQDDRIRVDG